MDRIRLPGATPTTTTTLARIALPYRFDALEPAIDTLTMELHWGRHYQTFFTNLNTLLANRTDLSALGITGVWCVCGVSNLTGVNMYWQSSGTGAAVKMPAARRGPDVRPLSLERCTANLPPFSHVHSWVDSVATGPWKHARPCIWANLVC